MTNQQIVYGIPALSRLIDPESVPSIIISIDPGEKNIGWATFYCGTLEESGVYHGVTVPLVMSWLNLTLPDRYPVTVVCEDYRIYPYMSESHTLSDVPTLRVIGAIELLCIQHGFDLVKQSASEAKQFVTDNKLRAWQLYQKSPHENDAIRHGLRYLIVTSYTNRNKKLTKEGKHNG